MVSIKCVILSGGHAAFGSAGRANGFCGHRMTGKLYTEADGAFYRFFQTAV